MDEWDEVVMLEHRAHALGHRHALSEDRDLAVLSEAREEAFRAGFLRGCAIGFELGFYSVATATAKDHQDEKFRITASRPKKLQLELHDRVSSFPRHNDSETDFDNEIQSLRSLYRGAGSKLGKFPPTKESPEENQRTDW
jgi:hypothetical protein